jgi:hypothetical protein
MAIFIERRSRNLFTPSTVDRIEDNTPLRDIDRRVLKEIVKENLGNPIVWISVTTGGKLTSLNSKPLLS